MDMHSRHVLNMRNTEQSIHNTETNVPGFFGSISRGQTRKREGEQDES